MANTIVTLRKFGMLTLEDGLYVLLRPVPFLPEYYEEYPGRKFYVAYYDECETPQAYNPHILVVGENCKYEIHFNEQDIPVKIYDGHRKQMEEIPTEIELEMRPIDMIAETDDDVLIESN